MLIRNFSGSSTFRPEFSGVVLQILGDDVVNRPFEKFLFFEAGDCQFHNAATLIIIEGDNAF